MSTLIRLAVIVYVIGLSLALVVGSWPLEGPVLLIAGPQHGVHAGDLGVIVATVVTCAVVVRSR